MKTCCGCKRNLLFSEFHKRTGACDGLQSVCKTCILKINREWAAKNPDRRRAQNRASEARYREKRRAKNKAWYKSHPEWSRHKTRQRKALKRGGRGKYTLNQWENLKKEYHYQCLRCRKSEPELKLTVDHVVPLSLGGDNTIANIQPLCGPCNSSKRLTIVDYRIIFNVM